MPFLHQSMIKISWCVLMCVHLCVWQLRLVQCKYELIIYRLRLRNEPNCEEKRQKTCWQKRLLMKFAVTLVTISLTTLKDYTFKLCISKSTLQKIIIIIYISVYSGPLTSQAKPLKTWIANRNQIEQQCSSSLHKEHRTLKLYTAREYFTLSLFTSKVKYTIYLKASTNIYLSYWYYRLICFTICLK